MAGHNKFRRFVLAHKSRKINGKFAEYPLSSGFNYRDPAPCNGILMPDSRLCHCHGETLHTVRIEARSILAGCRMEHRCCRLRTWQDLANTAGNWTVDTLRFPKGLRPVADEIHKVGAKFMVWFEPERVIRGTQWAVEHP